MLNSAQIKTLAVFSVFAMIGFGPISPGCLIGMYIVKMRPQWFLDLAQAMYVNAKALQQVDTQLPIKNPRIKAFLSLLTLFTIDILPVPVTPVIAFVVILTRPGWFYRVVSNVYADIRY